MTLAQQFVWLKLLLERTDTVPPLEKGKIQERLVMFDKLWEESPTVQKMREQYYEKVRTETLQHTLTEVIRLQFPD